MTSFWKKIKMSSLLKWEVITVVVLGVLVWFLFKWRKSMRIKETTVNIQFLDD